MAISQQIITLMGGDLQATSTLGEGSCFWFELDLPEVKDFAQRPKTQEQGTIVGYEGGRKTVLLTDDRWENRAVLTGVLSPLGFNVLEAENGREALAILNKPTHPIDLLITDLVMPEINGFELLAAVRQSPHLEKMVAISSSASVFESDQQQGIHAGADAFLAKPIQIDALLDMMAKHLGLVWRYEVQTPSPPSVAPPSTVPLIAPLPVTVWQQLSNLLAMGDTEALETQAALIQQEYPDAKDFALHLKHLAEICDLDEIERLIQVNLAHHVA
ncbi:MAG: response regulator [Cyanobacteria bacterium J06632_22]